MEENNLKESEETRNSRKNKNKSRKGTKKERWIRGIGYTMIVLAILGMALWFGRGWIMNYFSRFDGSLTVEEVEKNKKGEFKIEGIDTVRNGDLIKGINWNLEGVIGAIYLPSINTQTMITYGYHGDGQYKSVGTYQEHQEMGEVNNYVLAGHNMATRGSLFTDIGKMKLGDAIYLTDVKNVYEYITSNIVLDAKPSEGYYATTEAFPGRSLVTLISCTDDGAERIIVQGDFSQKWETKEAPKSVQKAFKLD